MYSRPPVFVLIAVSRAVEDEDAFVTAEAMSPYRSASSDAVTVGVVTEIAREYEGDAWAPTLGPEWRETARESHVAASGLGYDFATYER